MPEEITLERVTALHGTDVYASDGEKVGEVEDIYFDEQTNKPIWLRLSHGFVGRKSGTVPAQKIAISPEGLTVPYTKDEINDAPDFDLDELTDEDEDRLYAHYRMDPRTTTVTAETTTVTPEAARARVRKWTETETEVRQ
jgi:sporulation protein YlmC with PRC-barrel domain